MQSPHDNSTNLVTLSFQYLYLSEMFLFFHVEDNGILFEHAYSHFEDEFLTLPNFDFITAHSSFITAQMGGVTPLF